MLNLDIDWYSSKSDFEFYVHELACDRLELKRLCQTAQ